MKWLTVHDILVIMTFSLIFLTFFCVFDLDEKWTYHDMLIVMTYSQISLTLFSWSGLDKRWAYYDADLNKMWILWYACYDDLIPNILDFYLSLDLDKKKMMTYSQISLTFFLILDSVPGPLFSSWTASQNRRFSWQYSFFIKANSS